MKVTKGVFNTMFHIWYRANETSSRTLCIISVNKQKKNRWIEVHEEDEILCWEWNIPECVFVGGRKIDDIEITARLMIVSDNQ